MPQLHTILTNSFQLNVELLAVYLAIEHFRHYVKGRAFAVYTDHTP